MPSTYTLTAEGKQNINSILESKVREGKLPGLFFAAGNTNDILHVSTAGQLASGDPNAAPVDADTMFWLCSQTKLIVTIAALQLVEQGKVKLEDEIEDILPECRNPVVIEGYKEDGTAITKPAKNKMTLLSLLNHTSGMSYNLEGTLPFFLPPSYTHPYQPGEGSKKFFDLRQGEFSGQPLLFEPGTDWNYGIGDDATGFLVERITGMTLGEYFEKNIFKPVGMTTATFYPTTQNRQRLSFKEPSGEIVPFTTQRDIPQQDPPNIHIEMGGMTVHASELDYLRLLQHLLQILDGTAKNPILSVESVKGLFKPTLPEAAAKSFNAQFNQFGRTDGQWSTGLGLNMENWDGMRSINSGGWFNWANAYYLISPDQGVAAVLAAQLQPAGDKEFDNLWVELEKALFAGLVQA